MAVTAGRPHFIQQGDGPVCIGDGPDTLSCDCGRVLIQGYVPARFLALSLQCGGCGAVTRTPPLAEGASPPAAMIFAAEAGEARAEPFVLPPDTAVAGEAERERLWGFYGPRTPPSNVYTFDTALLDDTAARFASLTGAALPDTDADPAKGLARHALAWSVAHLRACMRDGDWNCTDQPPTAVASLTVAGFRHFVATWEQNLFFPAMVATAGEAGFSVHGLAPFAAAHMLMLQRNRIGFPRQTGYPGRIDHILLGGASGAWLPAYTRVFNRFEIPWGGDWDHASLRAAAQAAIEAESARINPKHPGLLLLSPGSAMRGFDEALIGAIKAALSVLGRRNRGLAAVAPIVLRLLPTRDPHAIQFGYGLFPLQNRHYRGDVPVMWGAPG